MKRLFLSYLHNEVGFQIPLANEKKDVYGSGFKGYPRHQGWYETKFIGMYPNTSKG